jgi:general secretion pathway protein F
MPVYEYTALNDAGKRLKGIIDADSVVAARQKLRESNIFPIGIDETSAKPKTLPSGQVSLASIFMRVKPVELSAVTRQLATLMGAGISLVPSLEGLLSQITNPSLKKVLAHIKESVNEGNSFAFALSQHPRLFSQIYINMVRAGEASGSLDLVLKRLAEFSEHNEALKGRVRAAMIYPIIMTIIGALALMLLVTFVVPKFVDVFSNMERACPFPPL